MNRAAPAGFFVLRTPRLAHAPIGDLRARGGDDVVQDALAAASPAVAALAARADGDLRARLSVTRYLARMSGRPTPRGLLAGVSTGRIGTRARLRVGGARPVSRLSAAAAAAIAVQLEADPELRDLLRYGPNPTVREAEPGWLRYVEDRGDGAHALVGAVAVPELTATLQRARGGRTLPDLAGDLVADGVPATEALAFVRDLAAAGLLVCDLAAPVHGPPPGVHLLERLAAVAPAAPAVRALEELHEVFATADAAPPGARAQALEAARGPAEQLGLRMAPHELVQVDLVREAPGLELPRPVADELLDALDALRRIVAPEEPPELARFRDAFRERYGEQHVPLLEALDPDAGVGFGAEMAGAPPADGRIAWGPPQQLMLRLVTEAAARGRREIDIASALPSLTTREPAPLPDAFAVLAALAAPPEGAGDGGRWEARLIGAVGPSGARLFGRFCHADEALRRHAAEHLRAEEALHPDAVFAEVAHCPSAAVGDIVGRPVLRSHEIGLLAGAAQNVHRIEPEQLDLSLEQDRLILRDRSGRRVIPRLTSAHDVFGDGLGLYRFLAMLQFDGLPAGVAWDWGPLAGAPFLPRVRLGRVVLALARWRIAPGELRALRQGSHEERAAAVAAWRRASGCPRFVGLPVQESALPLDLDDPVCAEILLREAPPDGHATVQEWWPAPEESAVSGPDGRYAHELLIPFVTTRAPVREPVRRRGAGAVRRILPPGSDWLFAKLYTSPARADALIAGELAPLARHAVAAGAARSWHFLRYADPGFHLRLRLHGDPDALREAVLPSILAAGERLVEGGAARRLVLDTYEREIERYGGDEGILLAERAFCLDSEAVARLLAELPHGEEPSLERWRLAAAGVWSLLGALGLDERESGALTARLRADFAIEQGLDKLGVRTLAAGLREARPAIDALLAAPPEALRDRDARLAPVAAALAALERDGRLVRTRTEIAAHLAHMHCNRLLRGSPRPQELVIHDALTRIAAGRAARARAAIAR